jgi:GntR family transcriptional regulator, transcriptional repressor for pyruvate dehydrogenase complex
MAEAEPGPRRTARPPKGPIREKPQLIADELRSLIVAGDLSEGDSLGHEPDLIERFGVSRPSLREALRILEAEGLITVVRGASGGVVVHAPNGRMTARTAALVLQARNVSLADVHEARSLLEPAAAATVARSTRRRSASRELATLIDAEELRLDDPDAFGVANAAFHERLVTLAGNQTLTIVAEMLNEVVSRAVAAVSQAASTTQSDRTRRRGIRSQRRLVELIADGDGAGAEEHWRAHMAVVGQVLLGQQATTVVDLLDHY